MTFKTNIDDIFIPSAMSENLLGDFIIQGFFTHQGKMNGKDLRNSTFDSVDGTSFEVSDAANISITGEPLLDQNDWLIPAIQILYDNSEISLSRTYSVTDGRREISVFFGRDNDSGAIIDNDDVRILSENIQIYEQTEEITGESSNIISTIIYSETKVSEKNSEFEGKSNRHIRIRLQNDTNSIEEILNHQVVGIDILSQYLRDLNLPNNNAYKYNTYSNKLIEYIPAAFFTDYSKMFDEIIDKKKFVKISNNSETYDTISQRDFYINTVYLEGYAFVDKYFIPVPAGFESDNDIFTPYGDDTITGVIQHVPLESLLQDSSMLASWDWHYALILIKAKETLDDDVDKVKWIRENLKMTHIYSLSFQWFENNSVQSETITVDFSTLGLISTEDTESINDNFLYNNGVFSAILLDLDFDNEPESKYPDIFQRIYSNIQSEHPTATDITYLGVLSEKLNFYNLDKYDALMIIPRILF